MAAVVSNPLDGRPGVLRECFLGGLGLRGPILRGRHVAGEIFFIFRDRQESVHLCLVRL